MNIRVVNISQTAISEIVLAYFKQTSSLTHLDIHPKIIKQ